MTAWYSRTTPSARPRTPRENLARARLDRMVVREGALVDDANTDPSVLGVRRLHERLSRDERVAATTLQTVGAKGYDGITLAIVDDR